jgi:type I restriction enzyme, S subunit
MSGKESDKKDTEDWVPTAQPIPSRWSYVEFENAFDVISTSALKIQQKDYLEVGTYPIIDQGQPLIGGFTDSNACVIDEDRALIIFGDHTKRFKFAPFPFAPGADGTKVLKPRAFLDEKFSYYACLSLRLPDRGYSRHYSFLKRSQFPVAPENEQRRIVEKIETLSSELDKGVESLETAREQLNVYRQAVLKHAFEGKLTARWREEHKDNLESADQLLARIKKERESFYQQEVANWKAAGKKWEEKGEKGEKGKKPPKPRAPKPLSKLAGDVRAGLPAIPDIWVWEKLGWMTCGVEYGTAAKSAETGLVPVIRMGDLQNGMIDWQDLAFTSDRAEIEKYSLDSGDVLFNRTNSPELVGKAQSIAESGRRYLLDILSVSIILRR